MVDQEGQSDGLIRGLLKAQNCNEFTAPKPDFTMTEFHLKFHLQATRTWCLVVERA